MASIGSFSGLASGIQWRDMVDQIMELEKTRKLSPVTTKISAQNARADAWTSFQTLARDLSSAATALKDGTAFGQFSVNVPKSETTSKELLAATVSTTAATGTYNVEVRALAKQEKIRANAPVASLSDARGLSGEFLVGGRAVTLEASDTLATIRDKINAVNSGANPSGVTASIVSVSPTEHYLTLTADSSGSRGIELVDSGDGTGTNGVLAQLTLLAGTQSANLSGGETQTQRFTSKDTAIATMLGISSPPATAAINVNGVRIEIDLLTDTISDVLDKIETAGQAASIETESIGGQTRYRLSTGPVTVNTDPGNDQAGSQRIIELLGFARGDATNTVQAGADAEVHIDGLPVFRRTNAITDAIPGMSLSLKAEEIGTVVSVDVRRDNAAITKKVESFVAAFNKVASFQSEQRARGGPLASDGSLRSAISSLKNVLLSDVAGIDAAATEYTRMGAAGIEFTDKGLLQVNTEKLTAALSSNFNDVKALFGAAGTATNSEVAYVAATSDTVPGSYAVNITQAATKPSVTGSAGVSIGGAGADKMMVFDAYTGKTAEVSLTAGMDASALIDALNDAFDAEGLSLTASDDGSGRLVLGGERYGAAASFTVSYYQGGSAYAGASETGVDAGTYAGLDVAGTIGGQAATGVGQLLTAGDGTGAEGLSITYTGTSTGAAGNVTYVSGVGGSIFARADAYGRSGDGLVASYLEQIEESSAALETRAIDIQTRLDRYEQALLKRFIAMESAIGKLQTTGNWLTNQINAMQGSGSQ